MLTGLLPSQAVSAQRRVAWHAAWIGFGWLALAAAVRLPFLGVVGEDEAFFAVVAHRWLGGVAPYVGSFDVKAPGLFAAYALADAAFGFETGAMKLLLIGCVGATSWGLWLIGKRHLSRPVGLFAGALYPLYSLTQSGTTSSSELIEVLPEVFAALLALDAILGGGCAALSWSPRRACSSVWPRRRDKAPRCLRSSCLSGWRSPGAGRGCGWSPASSLARRLRRWPSPGCTWRTAT
jgi:hypothetical protein